MKLKRFLTFLMISVFIILLIINGYIFGNGIILSENLNKLEKEIANLKKENSKLENRLAQIQSYENYASLSAKLNFIKTEPLVLENLKQAYKK